MLTDLDKTQTKTTRYISRYLPVEKACQANIEDIEGSARKIFEAHFNQKDDQGELIPRKVSSQHQLQKLNLTLISKNYSLLLPVEFAIAQSSHVWMLLINWLLQLDQDMQ